MIFVLTVFIAATCTLLGMAAYGSSPFVKAVIAFTAGTLIGINSVLIYECVRLQSC
jgi:hypothetical protein